MHVCHGSLCDACRARMLELMLRDRDQTTLTSHRTATQVNFTRGQQQGQSHQSVQSRNAQSGSAVEAEDRASLLKQLAEDGASRSVKEQLHSRLLSRTPITLNNRKDSVMAAYSSYYRSRGEPDLRSHFSDSSDDETPGDSGATSGGSREAARKHHAVPNQARGSSRASKLHQSRGRKKDDHDVFDLEI